MVTLLVLILMAIYMLLVTLMGTADFDPSEPTVNLSTSGGADAFVLKLDSNGRMFGQKHGWQ